MDLTIIARRHHNDIHINLYLVTFIIELAFKLNAFGALKEGIFHIS